jgi:hypothetical protein
MQAGIDILRQDKPEIVPWIWRVGGTEAEKKLEYSLGTRAKVRSQDLAWSPGVVGLDRIPILRESLEGFDVDREPLVEQVQQSLRQFSCQDLEALWP